MKGVSLVPAFGAGVFLIAGALMAQSVLAQEPAAEDPDVIDPQPELKTFQIQASPIGMLAGRYNGSVEFGVTDALSLGPKVTLMRKSFNGASTYLIGTETGAEVGLRGTYAFSGRRFSTGFFVRGGLMSASFQRSDLRTAFESIWDTNDDRTLVEIKGPMVEALVGYCFVAPTGFSFDIAGGFDTYFSKEKRVRARDGAVMESSASSFQRMISIEANVGLAF